MTSEWNPTICYKSSWLEKVKSGIGAKSKQMDSLFTRVRGASITWVFATVWNTVYLTPSTLLRWPSRSRNINMCLPYHLGRWTVRHRLCSFFGSVYEFLSTQSITPLATLWLTVKSPGFTTNNTYPAQEYPEWHKNSWFGYRDRPDEFLFECKLPMPTIRSNSDKGQSTAEDFTVLLWTTGALNHRIFESLKVSNTALSWTQYPNC